MFAKFVTTPSLAPRGGNLAGSSSPEIRLVRVKMLSYVAIAATTAAAFTPAAMPMPSTAPARASVAPVMTEMSSRRAALLGLAAATVPLAANAAAPKAVAFWKTEKKGTLGANRGPPKGSGADKCKVAKACTTGAGIKWDPKALGVAGGATNPDGSNPRKFFKTPTYANVQ